MFLTENLPLLFTETRNARRVLDVGGAYAPLNTATHVIDIVDFDQRREPLDRAELTRFTRETWSVHDICSTPWPFPDKHFDFAFCSHTLEDIRDPIAVCKELSRVASAGYVETPSRLRESFHRKRGYLLRRVVGRPIRVGFDHHRWFVEEEDGGLVFTAKTQASTHARGFFITLAELGRDLTPRESALALWWRGELRARERLLVHSGEPLADMRAFKARALNALKR